ncbi:MAG: response regulator transcription factor [Acidobacteria bacterium]|nr:response regulator transcription factor [Acidobacteriota bacterium]
MRVLVVEDEYKVASFLQKGLQQEGYTVDTASDGVKAIELAEAGDCDLIVLDVMMPKLDGFEVVRRLRARKNTCPILLLTARDRTEDKVTGLDLGADDYLVKPFQFAELLARIRALLRRATPATEPILSLADLELDPATHAVKRRGRKIDLSNKEYALLEYLLRNKEHAVTRNMILQHVWDMAFDSFTNIVDVYINSLRNKIDKGFDEKLIHTIRGVGYTLKREP